MLPRPSGIVTLLTDFGTADPYVAVMKGMVLRQNPKAVLIDLGHEVLPQDVTDGAFWLAAAIDRFPAGTVHVAVVDPGVGTDRRLLAAAAHEAYWLAPDNGLLGHVLARDPAADVRAIDLDHLNLRPASRTFHGRDVFAPVAGWLSGGRYSFTALGARATGLAMAADAMAGAPRVVHVDGFGNLITNVPAAALTGISTVRIAGAEIAVHGAYADVPEGALLALVGSYGLLEIAANRGSAAKTLGAGRGAPVELRPQPSERR
ncbi:MAG: SAM-dependent chlorinase/fluorinase [Planctomycetota bacterium]|nr:SAM-dependent chlorinase/fluorinase [Planctomycetota bacterium]